MAQPRAMQEILDLLATRTAAGECLMQQFLNALFRRLKPFLASNSS
jgi:hypothetical protein